MNRSAAARDFRGHLEAAVATADSQARLTSLTHLAAADPSYLESIQIDKALDRIDAASQDSHTPVRLAVLGSSTIDHLLPAVRVAALPRHVFVTAHAGGFGQYRQEILDPASPLGPFGPDMVLLSLSAGDVLGGIAVSATKDEADRAIAGAVADLRVLWRTVRERFGAVAIQQSFLDVTLPLFGSHDALVPGAPSRLVSRLNAQLADAAAEDGALWLDVARATARDGLEAWFDAGRWLQGKIEIAPAAAGRYGELLARVIGAQLGHSKKCLVLDLDNTLWGGVIGDVGHEGIVLGEGSALGEAHLALQKYARQLKDRGVVLAVCSKNEWPVVRDAFDRHPEMHLRREDIAAFAVNWGDKAENLRVIAQELNLGLDSLVFVDDNPVERARVRESLPMVAVPELPDDAAGYVRFLAEAGYFEATNFTDEDRRRADQYAANIERESLRDAAGSMDDFLRGLEMSVRHGPVSRADLPRAGQLINKTNQFNTTTRRFKSEELAQFVADSRNLALQFRLVDRFGDNGLVSVMLFRPDPALPGVLELVNWVMSCRVFGRQLEDEAMNIAVDAARERGVRAFAAEYIPTEKNGVIGDLFARLGFACARSATEAGGASRWTLDLAAFEDRPTHIRRRADAS